MLETEHTQAKRKDPEKHKNGMYKNENRTNEEKKISSKGVLVEERKVYKDRRKKHPPCSLFIWPTGWFLLPAQMLWSEILLSDEPAERQGQEWEGGRFREGEGYYRDASGPSRKGSLPSCLCQQDQLTENWNRTAPTTYLVTNLKSLFAS